MCSKECGYCTDQRHRLDQKPPIRTFDESIKTLNGTTWALEFQTDAMQAAKRIKFPTSEQRIIDLIRQTSAIQAELQFFRIEFEAAQTLVGGLHTASHQMYLNYFAHSTDSQLHVEWFNLAQEIDTYLRRYDEVIKKAEADWIELSRRHTERDRSSWI